MLETVFTVIGIYTISILVFILITYILLAWSLYQARQIGKIRKKEGLAMARTLQEVLDTDLSADKMGDYTPNELAKFLVDNNIVENTADVNRIIIEGIQKALLDDDEFPIHYYSKDEPMSEEGKAVDAGPCLTDEYIENNMNS